MRHQIEEMWNKGYVEAAEEFFTTDFVSHDPANPEEVHGPEGFRQYVSTVREAFPDYHLRIEDQIAEGDKVATRYVITCTHEGEIQGIAPTGPYVEITGTGIDRLSDGKVAEFWEIYDALGLMQQLGIIPSPEPSPQA